MRREKRNKKVKGKPAQFSGRPTTTTLVLITLLSSSVVLALYAIFSEPNVFQNINEKFDNDAPKQQLPPTHTLFGGKRKLCPSTVSLLDTQNNYRALRDAFREAEFFHNGGGNIKSIERYLNRNIDKTFERLGLEFVASSGESPSKESISATVRELLKNNDPANRGGYNQRSLPGKFISSTTMHKKILNKRTIDVLEPHDSTRWIAGLGPIANKICKSIDTIAAKDGKKSYEDKFMCSFDELLVTNKATKGAEITGNFTMEACEIMSIGSNGQWGFENNIHRTTKCITRTFDCTTKNNPKKTKH